MGWELRSLRRLLAIAFAAAACGLLLAAIDARSQASVASGGHDGTAGHGAPTTSGHAMSSEEVRRWVDDFYASHPVRPGLEATAAADTFRLLGSSFDTDGSAATVVDTARIFVGQNILWRLVSGTHTVTSGTGSSDPQVGQRFDVPMPPSTEFSFVFDAAGKFPFFCRPHEFFNMRGVVEVLQVSDVGRVGGRTGRTGFVSAPAPNPTHGLTAFHFSVQEAGHVRVDVYDARGRQLAAPVDRDLDAGTYMASWDGRTRSGALAPAGVYYLRLQTQGHAETRQVVLMH